MKIGNMELKECADIRAAMCEVTPRQAEELLLRNTHNRKISDSTVARYVTEMENGEWVPTASGIGIDDNGVLSDGQQRLSAVVKFGRPVPMLIVTGIPSMAQEKVDRQRKRTMADVFHLAGICQDKKPVQVATFLARVAMNKDRASGSEMWVSPADSEVKAAFENHRQAIMAMHKVGKVQDKGIGQVGVFAALVLAYEVHGDKAVEFFKRIREDIFSRHDDPARRLRRALTGEGGTVGSAKVGTGAGLQFRSFRKTLYAFNAFSHGRFINQCNESNEVEA